MTSSHRHFVDNIGTSPIATVISDPARPDNPLVSANAAFCDLTGYAESEIVGRNCRFLAGDRTEPRVSDIIRSAIRDVRPVLVEIINYRKDGTAFRNGVMITPLFGEDSRLEYFLGSQVDLGPADDLALRRSTAAAKVAALPPRQREILQAMSNGLLNKQIAYKLGITEKTVKMHRELLIDRIGAATSADAIRIAVEAGL